VLEHAGNFFAGFFVVRSLHGFFAYFMAAQRLVVR
jgi:hypothetical protein